MGKLLLLILLFSCSSEKPKETFTKEVLRDTVNIVKPKKDTMNYILHDLRNKKVVDKYLEKLPHKDIQIKKMQKYGIPYEAGIIINFIESDFTSDLKLVNKGFNVGGGKDYGSMQINSKYHPKIEDYVRSNNVDGYYDYAYSHMKNIKVSSFQESILRWNSKTPSVQETYKKNFIKRANTELLSLYW